MIRLLPLLILLTGCGELRFNWRDRPPEPSVRFCLAQREVILRRGETLNVVELQPCVPAVGEFR